MKGLDLLKLLIESTGLPAESIERELSKILNERAVSPQELSLDDLRELLSSYLQEVLVEAKTRAQNDLEIL